MGDSSINKPLLTFGVKEDFEGKKFKGKLVLSIWKDSLSKIKLSLSKRKAFKTKTVSFIENRRRLKIPSEENKHTNIL